MFKKCFLLLWAVIPEFCLLQNIRNLRIITIDYYSKGKGNITQIPGRGPA